MFERLVVTETREKNRRGYFALTSLVLGVGLVVALVVSLFAADISLGTNDFDMTALIAPVEIAPDEPKLPEPAPRPATPMVRSSTNVPTRQANIARLDETPPAVPTEVSTIKNTQKERPASRYFEIGKFDSDPAGAPSTGRSTNGAPGGVPGGLASGDATVAKVEEDAGPPPPVKQAPPRPSRPQSMGVINGKATELPMPVYTAAARAVNAHGSVSVQVLVDERGNVVSANAVSGHPLLRPAAESAARRARFSPTLLSGEPVKVAGVIVYNFNTGG